MPNPRSSRPSSGSQPALRTCATVAMVALAGCSRETTTRPVPAPPPSPTEPPAPAVASPRAAVAPVVDVAGHRYVELDDWLEAWLARPVPEDLDGWGPITPGLAPTALDPDDRELRVQAVRAPPPGPALVGPRVPAYDAAGHRCDARLGALVLLDHAPPTRMGSGTSPVVAAEVVTTGGCAPVLITDLAAPRFFAPDGAPTAAEQAQATAAVRRITPDWVSGGEDSSPWAEVSSLRLRDSTGRVVVLATFEEAKDGLMSGCGHTYFGFRALVELPAGGAAIVRGTSVESLGGAALVALVAGGDGPLVAVYGPADLDLGMEIAHDIATTVTFAGSPSSVRRLRFEAPMGCD